MCIKNKDLCPHGTYILVTTDNFLLSYQKF